MFICHKQLRLAANYTQSGCKIPVTYGAAAEPRPRGVSVRVTNEGTSTPDVTAKASKVLCSAQDGVWVMFFFFK